MPLAHPRPPGIFLIATLSSQEVKENDNVDRIFLILSQLNLHLYEGACGLPTLGL